jgi:hypothetical protein
LVGDADYVPFLRKTAESVEGFEGPSQKRQFQYAQEAVKRLTGTTD